MIRVLLVALDPDSAEENAAWAWLAAQSGMDAERVAAAVTDAAGADVVWVHAAAVPAEERARHLLSLRPRGGFLLTGGAAALASPRAEVSAGEWRDATDDLFFHDTFTESPRLRGHAGFRAHPLFDGLHDGAFTWWPHESEPYTRVTHPRTTAGVRVVAAERAYIHVNPERTTAWEVHEADAPPQLCIGAYLAFAPRDPFFRRQVERLAHNALVHVARGCAPADAAAYWPAPATGARRDDTLPLPHTGPQRPGRISFAASPLRLAGGEPHDPFTLAGRRALAAGTEGDGVVEFWAHPIRAVAGLRIANAAALGAEVTALGLERTLRVEDAVVDERIMVPHELPALVVEWETLAQDVRLEIEWRTDLRLMWPYPAGVLGDLLWRTHTTTFVAHAAGAADVVCCHFSRAPDWWIVEPVADAPAAVRVRASVVLRAGESLRLLCAASSSGDDDLNATLAALRDPISLARARTASLRRLQQNALAVSTPEPQLDAAIEWAKYRLDSYIVSTPGVGRSLVAGYWHSRPGWGDGRPGYAWYFGRDAVWTALAALAVGDFAASRDVIRFLGELQDLNGKILHECTTSGLVHYDAADATPLYLLLVARHHAWTGEIAFLNGEWDHVQRALRFCLATDTDDDELIENPRVGHGWIEFGPLGGGKLTYYNAGIWTAVLRELATVAEDIGDRTLAIELHTRAKRARLALEERFFDPARRRYALKAWQAGDAWHADYTPTATHAVPLLLGVADADRAAGWLDDVASDDFSTPWGVRMIARSHERFDPKSYHGGAVWPLYTGWTAWAEYAAGRDRAALAHLLANAALPFERAKGAWDEVLHGQERVAIGVCPDQAWSTAMVVAPLVYGMLGAEPDASRNRLRLRPQLPREWEHFEARAIRIGDNAVTLRYERHRDHHVFRLEQEHGAVPVRIIFEPVLHARALRSAQVDGVPAQLSPTPFGGRMLVPVQLVLDAERVIELHSEPPEDA